MARYLELVLVSMTNRSFDYIFPNRVWTTEKYTWWIFSPSTWPGKSPKPREAFLTCATNIAFPLFISFFAIHLSHTCSVPGLYKVLYYTSTTVRSLPEFHVLSSNHPRWQPRIYYSDLGYTKRDLLILRELYMKLQVKKCFTALEFKSTRLPGQ